MSTNPTPNHERLSSTAPPPRSLLDQIVDRAEAGRTDSQRLALSSVLDELLSNNWPNLTAAFSSATEDDRKLSVDFKQLVTAEIAAIDKNISAVLNEGMHTEKFKQLEASWRGLHSLVTETELTEMIKIRVLNVTKQDLRLDLKNDYLESELFRKLHDTGYGVLGGEPYGALIGDFEFGPDDAALLSKIASVSAIVHAPFVAAASPRMFGWKRFSSLSEAGPIFEIFKDTAYAKWKEFRSNPNSRYVGLVLPHTLMREPYGQSADADKFDFQFAEDVAGQDSSKYLWGNAAYAYGKCLTGAFFNYYWCTAIRGVEGGGLVELPFHTFREDGATVPVGPTEVAITDPQDKELSTHGFIALVQQINTPKAVFFSGQSCQAPTAYYLDEATASANLSARLPNIFATSRFAHYLKAIVRDKIGSFMSQQDCATFLNNWIGNYVTTRADADQATKARFPLREARIEVEDVPGQPGAYRAVAYLRPHFQLEEIAISLRLVANLPSPKN
jgi:type VI secretion system protein ImpC